MITVKYYHGDLMMERLINALEERKLKDYNGLTQTAIKLLKKNEQPFHILYFLLPEKLPCLSKFDDSTTMTIRSAYIGLLVA